MGADEAETEFVLTSTDPLSAFISLLDLQRLLLWDFELGAPWRVRHSEPVQPTMHYLREGGFVTSLPTGEVELARGDALFFPRGRRYELADSADSRPPFVDGPDRPTGRCSVRAGGTGAQTNFICCGFLFAPSAVPLLRLLPDVVLCRASQTTMIERRLEELLAATSCDRVQGQQGVVLRLAELLFLEILRSETSGDEDLKPNLLRALAEPQLGRALGRFHQRLGGDWTVAKLSASAGMSRARFSQLFLERLGESPMRYVQRSRLLEAARLLRSSTLNLADIAERVGYTDPTSFSRAFKREYGQSPREYRREWLATDG